MKKNKSKNKRIRLIEKKLKSYETVLSDMDRIVGNQCERHLERALKAFTIVVKKIFNNTVTTVRSNELIYTIKSGDKAMHGSLTWDWDKGTMMMASVNLFSDFSMKEYRTLNMVYQITHELNRLIITNSIKILSIEEHTKNYCEDRRIRQQIKMTVDQIEEDLRVTNIIFNHFGKVNLQLNFLKTSGITRPQMKELRDDLRLKHIKMKEFPNTLIVLSKKLKETYADSPTKTDKFLKVNNKQLKKKRKRGV